MAEVAARERERRSKELEGPEGEGEAGGGRRAARPHPRAGDVRPTDEVPRARTCTSTASPSRAWAQSCSRSITGRAARRFTTPSRWNGRARAGSSPRFRAGGFRKAASLLRRGARRQGEDRRHQRQGELAQRRPPSKPPGLAKARSKH
jgi:hypothetical protein